MSTWWGICAIVLGVLLIGIYLTAGMPIGWMLGEAKFTIGAGSAVLVLQRSQRHSNPQDADLQLRETLRSPDRGPRGDQTRWPLGVASLEILRGRPPLA